MGATVRFRVDGSPAPKGSFRIVTKGRGGRSLPFPRVLKDSAKTYTWERVVAESARRSMAGELPLDGPLGAEIEFRFPTPKGKRERERGPCTKATYDMDKLVRSTLDGVTKGGAIADDSRVVDLRTRKRWCVDGEEPGAEIAVWLIA